MDFIILLFTTWSVSPPATTPTPPDVIAIKDIIMAVVAFVLALLLYFFRNTISQLNENVRQMLQTHTVRVDGIEDKQREDRARIRELEQSLDQLRNSLPDKDQALRDLVAEAKAELNCLALDMAKKGVTKQDCQDRIGGIQRSINALEEAITRASVEARETRDVLQQIKGEMQAFLS